jgi:inorganic pyrophosphatase
MYLEKLTPGDNAPDEVNVVIEIPVQSAPVKYELDKESGSMVVDRFMTTAMFYPCNYGFVPKTLSDDGDPVDVLVAAPHPLITGCVIQTRPVGMLKMTDEAGEDAKILAVPIDKLCRQYAGVNAPEDLPETMLAQIAHFFEHYKDLEKDKWVKIQGWLGADAAKKEILDSIARYNAE